MNKKNILDNKVFIIIAGIIDFLANVAGIITTLNVSETIGITIIIITIITFIIVLASLLFNLFKANKAIASYKRITEKLHHETLSELHHIIHDIRDNSFYIIGCKENLDKTFRKIEVSICTRIEKLLGKIFNRKTSVCIKLLKAEDILDFSNNKNKDWIINTVARGENSTGRERNDNIPISIGENSDFKIILEGKVDFFKSPNMKSIRDDFQKEYRIPYLNSRDSHSENFTDFYNATIVVPIRIKEDNFNISEYDIENQNNNYHILGFLCIDTLEPFVTNDELTKFNLGIEYAKAIADSMYYQIFCYFMQRFEQKVNIC